MDYGRAYPLDKAQARVDDIQVKREGTQIVFTNTTDHAFGPLTMWLNGEFSREIDGIAIGETVRLSLSDFRNEFGERFRAGGFFATEKPSDVVLAQFEIDAQLVGLVVVRGQAER